MADPIVTIKQGQLKGTTDISLDGGKYLKFFGIPYAKPPVGPLRFKAPQPAESWTGTRDATKEGNHSYNLDMLTHQLSGSEDCLYLNVYTKELPTDKNKPLKPVMVYIHGGGFTMGSSSEIGGFAVGSQFLLTQDIVLVSINYRLGIFGFLSSDDLSLEIPGNAGLKDQTMALKWVQDNIFSFGGDPDNVTIFGVSAGGASVHHQILTATSKGLFHKAIAESGAVLNPWAWGQKNNATQAAEKLGYAVSTEKEALDVLLKSDPADLFKVSMTFDDILEDSSQRRPFGPVIEKQNPTAFLTENPTSLIKAGNFNHVPTIMGFTSGEGLIYGISKLMGKGGDIDPLECGILWNLGLEDGSQKRDNLRQSIKDFYYKDGTTKEAIRKVVGDACFMVGIAESVKLAAKNSISPLYLYLNAYEAPMVKQFGLMFGNEPDYEGVMHGGEHMLLFKTSINELTEEDREAITSMVKIWTDFAKTGKPHEQWKPVQDKNFKYAELNKKLILHEGFPFAERFAFWENIFKEFGDVNGVYKENSSS